MDSSSEVSQHTVLERGRISVYGHNAASLHAGQILSRQDADFKSASERLSVHNDLIREKTTMRSATSDIEMRGWLRFGGVEDLHTVWRQGAR